MSPKWRYRRPQPPVLYQRSAIRQLSMNRNCSGRGLESASETVVTHGIQKTKTKTQKTENNEFTKNTTP